MFAVLNMIFRSLFGILLAAIPLAASAAFYEVPIAGVYTGADGHTYQSTTYKPVPRIGYPSMATTTPLNIPVASMVPPGRQLMVIPTTITPNVARVGKAVTSLARLSGPVGMGLTLLPILCEETGICDPDNNHVFDKVTPPYTGQSRPGYLSWPGSYDAGYTFYDNLGAACGSAYLGYPNTAFAPNGDNGSYGACTCNGPGCPYDGWQLLLSKTTSCVPSGSKTNVSCTVPEKITVPTETDWTNAASKLATSLSRMANILDGLQEKNIPIPIDKPVLTPSSETLPSITTVEKDANSNPVKTTTQTTTVSQTPVVDTNPKNSTTITEKTITTVTNNTTNTTTTTETTKETPQEVKAPMPFDFPDDYNREKTQI